MFQVSKILEMNFRVSRFCKSRNSRILAIIRMSVRITLEHVGYLERAEANIKLFMVVCLVQVVLDSNLHVFEQECGMYGN